MTDTFDKKPEDTDFSKFLPSESEIQEILELSSTPTNSTPTDVVVVTKTTAIDPTVERDIDYDYARNNLKEIIETSKTALTGLNSLAQQSQHPRAYEVFTLLINSIVEANKKLMDVHKQRQELDLKEKEAKRGEEGPKQQVTNNNLFVGSSAQLLDFVKTLSKPEPDGK